MFRVLPGVVAAAITLSLTSPAPASPAEIAIGDANAPVTIIQYTSLRCDRCRTYLTTSFPEIRARYIRAGKARYIFREAPVDALDAAAFLLARCAAKSNSETYAATVIALTQQQAAWDVPRPLEPLRGILAKAGMSDPAFNACLAAREMSDKLSALHDHVVQNPVLKGGDLPALYINGRKYDYVAEPDLGGIAGRIDAILKAR